MLRPRLIPILIWITVVAITMPLISCENSDEQAALNDAIKMITDASQQKDFSHMQVLADSLGKEKVLSEAESYFWQGFAYYRMSQVHTAEFYWKEAMAAIESSDDPADLILQI